MADKKLKRLLEGLLSDEPVEGLSFDAPRKPVVVPAGRDSVGVLERQARQAMHLKAASDVSRAASSILSLDELLPRVVALIQEHFGLYYVGIFLVQEEGGDPEGAANQWAVIQAGTGDAGRQMVARQHRLRVGGDSMIGSCIAMRQPRVALDVGVESVRFDNPLLPATRSEAALPLISRGQVIGAMTFQSTRPVDFSTEDISVLQNMTDQLANAIENARLFEDRERQIAELSIVNEIGRAVSSIQDLEDLLETVYLQVSRLFDTTNFYIATYEETSDEWILALALEHGERQPSSRFRSTAGLTGHILHTQRPLLLRTAAEIDQLHEQQQIHAMGERARSWLGVPLVTAGRVVGVMAIQDYRQENTYGDRDLQLFTTVAAQIANALENVQLLSRTQRWAQNLNALHRLSLELAREQRELRVLLGTATQRSMELLDSDGGGIWLWRDQDRELELVVTYQVGDANFAGRRLKPGEGLSGRAFSEARLQIVDDYLAWDGHAESFGDAPFASAMAVPLIWQNELVGILALTRSEPGRPFSPDEQNLAQLLAAQAAAVIENANLFDQARRRAQEQSMLLRVAEAVNRAQEMEDLLKRALDAVIEWIGFDAGLFSLQDPKTGQLILVTHRGVPETMVARLEQQGMQGTLCELVFKKQEPVGIRDVSVDAPVDVSGLIRLGLRSYAGVPLLYQEQCLGTLCCFNYATRELADRDLELLEAAARQIGLGIGNTRLLAETRARAALLNIRIHQLDCLSDVSRKIDEVPSLPEFLEWVAWRVPQAVRQPDLCRVAVEFEDHVYGTAEAKSLPAQMVQSIQSGGERAGQVCIAYTEDRGFLDEESAFLGDLTRRVSGYIENRRLFEQTQGALDEAGMLYRVARSLGQIRDEREMYEFVLGEYLGSLGLPQGGVLIFDEDGRYGTMKALMVDGRPVQPGLRIPVAGNPACERMITTREPVAITDAFNDEMLGPVRELAGQLGYKSLLLVPILSGLEVVGALGADSVGEIREFTSRDIALVRAVADQLGIAMENRRLIRETQAALAEVEATNRRYLRRAWEDHLRQRELLQKSAFLLDRAGSDPEEVWSASPELWQPEMEHAVREGSYSGIDGAMAVPITLRGQTIGVLGIESPDGERPWTDEDLALVEAIGDQLAQTLETARLFADTQRRAERERLIGEITTKIRASTDMQDILATAATELGQALGVSRAFVRLGVEGQDEPREDAAR